MLEKLNIQGFYRFFFTAIFILILIQFPFANFESIFYDLWIKLTPKSTPTIEYSLIGLDETNDQILGEYYPYSYATHLKFIKKIIDDEPKAVVYLVNFDEPNVDEDQVYYDEFSEFLAQYQLRGGIFRFGTSLDLWGEQIPPEKLKRLEYSPALVHVDGETFAKDSIHRRAILNISGEDSLQLWLANKIRESVGEKKLDAKEVWGSFYNGEADAVFAHYRHKLKFLGDSKHLETLPFYKVLNGNFKPGHFKDKVVIIGPNYLSNSDDFSLTSLDKDKKVPKILIHASIVNSLVQEKTLFKVPDFLTDLLSLILALTLSLIISKFNPTRGLLISLAVLIGVLILSYLFFAFGGLWFKVAHILLSLFIVVYVWFPLKAMTEYQTRFAIEEESKILKQVEHLKQNFISLMSHDLKTPVAKIQGIADTLKYKLKDEEPLKLVGDITSSTKELNSFITSILDLTKIESSNLKLNFVSKDINQIVEDVISGLEFERSVKNIEINSTLAPLYPIKVDEKLIHRVMANIIENAIKYTPENSQIDIITEDDEQWVYISVRDNGQGIPKKSLEHIFDKFYRVKNDETHKIKGSGLGLYLVKYFVELHEGAITVESEVGTGTTFMIKLKNE